MLSDSNTLVTTVWNAPAPLPIPVAKKEAALSLHYHVVFYIEAGVTLSEEWRAQFYRFLEGGVRGLGGRATVGGAGSRIDLLVSLPPASALPGFIKRLKILSASWARRRTTLGNFAWKARENVSTVSSSEHGRLERQITRSGGRFHYFGTENQYVLPQWCAPKIRGMAVQI